MCSKTIFYNESDYFFPSTVISAELSSMSSIASALFCGSGLAVLMRQRLLRQIEAKPTLTKVLPPVAKKVPFSQYFGSHPDRPGEYRGEDVMDPPKTRNDDYQWLRDDSRTSVEVSIPPESFCLVHHNLMDCWTISKPRTLTVRARWLILLP